jgi:hypothetical protein
MRGLIESSPSPKGGLRTIIVIPWHREQVEEAAMIMDEREMTASGDRPTS